MIAIPPRPSWVGSGEEGIRLDVGEPVDERAGRESPEGGAMDVVLDPYKQRIAELRARMEDHARVDGWEKTYAAFASADLLKERDVIEHAIEEATWDEYERRFRSGQYEVIATDGAFRDRNLNTCEVACVRFAEHGMVLKVLLPEAGFEEVYKLRAQSTWLWEEARRRDLLRVPR